MLGLYLLNLLVANSSLTTNNREKIDVDDLVERLDPDQKEQAGLWDGISSIVTQPRRFFEGSDTNQLRGIFEFIAQVYLNLTCHSSNSSYYGKAAAGREEDLDPSEFLLDVVNDAKTLRNKVEDFLSVPRNTFENERPTPRRLQNVNESAERDFNAILSTPVDLKHLIIEARRRS